MDRKYSGKKKVIKKIDIYTIITRLQLLLRTELESTEPIVTINNAIQSSFLNFRTERDNLNQNSLASVFS